MCGICGVYILDEHDLPDIARALSTLKGIDAKRLVEDNSAAGVIFFLLKHLNNRGRDSSGIVTFDGRQYFSHKDMGLAEDVFTQEILERLKGRIGIGHDRYATTGLPKKQNMQPFSLSLENRITGSDLHLALGHNGNITNEKELRSTIGREESRIFGYSRLTSSTDSELILHHLALELCRHPDLRLEKAVQRSFTGINKFRGSYSLVGIVNDNLFGIRDAYGTWPLHIARLGNLMIFSSEGVPIRHFIEASAYQMQPSDFIRSVREGNIEVMSQKGLATYNGYMPFKEKRECAFDYSYLRSHEDGQVGKFRKTLGALLWKRFSVNVDYVVPVPNSGVRYAEGLSKASNIPFEILIGINQNYKGRTFQEPTPRDRLKATREKYAFRDSYKGLNVILTDDSIVRNTTMAYLIKELRFRDVNGIHIRIGTPPIPTPCYLGIHTPTKDELIANTLSETEIENYFMSIFYGADFGKEEVISYLKSGLSVEEIIAKSIHEEKNYLKGTSMTHVKKGEFSLKYIPMEDYRKAFDIAGLNSKTKCYACQIPNGNGYPSEIRNDLLALGVI